jgi:cell division protease FtsH
MKISNTKQSQKDQAMSQFIRNLFLVIIILFVALALFFYYKTKHGADLPTQCYTDFLKDVDSGNVAEIEMTGSMLQVTRSDGKQYETVAPDAVSVVARVDEKDIRLTFKRDYSLFVWITLLFIIFMILAYIGWTAFLQRQGQEAAEEEFGRKKIITFGKENRVTFADVAGISAAKIELEEIISFLKDPARYQQIGATIPKGVMLQGPPGTGKTLLAKAIAGESEVPFYSISGSDFVETFVGVGASRVRDLFEEARKNVPCIIFIDEIDAVGARRSSSMPMGGQDERGQTLNALLVEIDGFGTDDTILLLAATNRPDILDPALLRSGRFDRQITILPPDVNERKKILAVHVSKVAVGKKVPLDDIARATPGFTGAELANLVNEAALLAVRKGRQTVLLEDFDAARDRILLGIERKGMVLSDNDRKALAYHEAGHAILAHIIPEADPLQKVTIIPRGRALGQTQQLPLADQHAYSREKLLARITILMGGRAAEEIIYHTRSTGAQEDLLQATELAIAMICKWGMAKTLPPRAYISERGGFLGREEDKLFSSEDVEKDIDKEINRLLEYGYKQALDILLEQKNFLTDVAEILVTNETLDKEELDIIFNCTVQKCSPERG